MRTKEQIEKEIAKLQQELANLNTDKRPFIPSEGDTFYCVNELGVVNEFILMEHTHLIKNIPVFRTYEATEHYAKVNRATLAVERRIAELNAGWWPDFKEQQEKWSISQCGMTGVFEGYCSLTYQEHQPQRYLKSLIVAEKLINEMPNELKLMITGE